MLYSPSRLPSNEHCVEPDDADSALLAEQEGMRIDDPDDLEREEYGGAAWQ
jgi:hypothetical protein